MNRTIIYQIQPQIFAEQYYGLCIVSLVGDDVGPCRQVVEQEFGHRLLGTDEESPDRATVEVFNAHLLIPSTLHDAGDAYGIVSVALVDLHFQSRLSVPGVDADDGQP
jgi:hypothetical protein